jgi:hypothetical protein
VTLFKTDIMLAQALAHKGDQCFIWPGYREKNGRSLVCRNGRRMNAANFVCRAAHGDPPTPLHEAAHSCGRGHDNCASPHHLRWATRKENHADAKAQGTWTHGERCNQSRLTEEDIHEIRRLRPAKTLRELADRFGVSKAAISCIATGKTWAAVREAQQ